VGEIGYFAVDNQRCTPVIGECSNFGAGSPDSLQALERPTRRYSDRQVLALAADG